MRRNEQHSTDYITPSVTVRNSFINHLFLSVSFSSSPGLIFRLIRTPVVRPNANEIKDGQKINIINKYVTIGFTWHQRNKIMDVSSLYPFIEFIFI